MTLDRWNQLRPGLYITSELASGVIYKIVEIQQDAIVNSRVKLPARLVLRNVRTRSLIVSDLHSVFEECSAPTLSPDVDIPEEPFIIERFGF